jgi:uncharacterized membrane protein YhhN
LRLDILRCDIFEGDFLSRRLFVFGLGEFRFALALYSLLVLAEAGDLSVFWGLDAEAVRFLISWAVLLDMPTRYLSGNSYCI